MRCGQPHTGVYIELSLVLEHPPPLGSVSKCTSQERALQLSFTDKSRIAGVLGGALNKNAPTT